MGLSFYGQHLLLAWMIGGVLTGILFGLVSMPRWARLLLLCVAPVAAIVIYAITKPDPGCHYDCLGNAAWAFFVAVALAAWYASQAVTLALRSGISRLERR